MKTTIFAFPLFDSCVYESWNEFCFLMVVMDPFFLFHSFHYFSAYHHHWRWVASLFSDFLSIIIITHFDCNHHNHNQWSLSLIREKKSIIFIILHYDDYVSPGLNLCLCVDKFSVSNQIPIFFYHILNYYQKNVNG